MFPLLGMKKTKGELGLETFDALSNEEMVMEYNVSKARSERTELADARDKMPAELSGGMRKRIGLARGIIMDPELILYDEPSAGLDPVISSVIDELIIELSEKIGAASVIVTHEMESAFKIATRLAMLFKGRVIAEGTPEDFKNSTDPVVAQFITGATEGPILEGGK